MMLMVMVFVTLMKLLAVKIQQHVTIMLLLQMREIVYYLQVVRHVQALQTEQVL